MSNGEKAKKASKVQIQHAWELGFSYGLRKIWKEIAKLLEGKKAFDLYTYLGHSFIIIR